MRITGGDYKGRRLAVPKRMDKTRPTTDYARESLFNILTNRFASWEEQRIADIFAGTGAVGLEALSRSAARVDFVDKQGSCLAAIRQSLQDFAAAERAVLHKQDAVLFLSQAQKDSYTCIFADPPYAWPALANLPQQILASPCLELGGFCIVEHDQRQDFRKDASFIDERSYGQTRFSFFLKA